MDYADDVRMMLVGMLILIFLIILYTFFLLHHHARYERTVIRYPKSQALPSGSLPATILPLQRVFASLLVYRILNTRLTQPFYDREEVDKSRPFLIHPASKLSECTNNGNIIFLAHASRSATTLLCKMLDIHGGVCTFREPSLLTTLLLETENIADFEESNSFALAKSIINCFVNYAKYFNFKKLVIKLPSVASRKHILLMLSAACPNAKKIYIKRDKDEIIRSHLKTARRQPTEREKDMLRFTIEQKCAAAASWADHCITYTQIVESESSFEHILQTLGLSNLSASHRMEVMKQLHIDAKTGQSM